MQSNKPTALELMAALPSWPMNSRAFSVVDALAWQASNVPWEYTSSEFEEQTKLLVANNCSPRDLLAWLVHGVRWIDDNTLIDHKKAGKTLANIILQDSMSPPIEAIAHFWQEKGPYLRAWIEGTNGAVDQENIKKHCDSMKWHPAWQRFPLPLVLADFSWVRAVHLETSPIEVSMHKLSSLGHLEMAHTTDDYAIRFSCAECMGKTVFSVNELGRASMKKLSPFFQRCLLITCLEKETIAESAFKFAHLVPALWTMELPAEEQAWWVEKSRGMVFTQDNSDFLLNLGVHPFSLVHRKRAQELVLLEHLCPSAFCNGSDLNNLLSLRQYDTLALPDLGANEFGL